MPETIGTIGSEDSDYWYRENAGSRQRKPKKSNTAHIAESSWEDVPGTKSPSKLKQDLGYSEGTVSSGDKQARAKAALEAMRKRQKEQTKP